tara:strand:- start:1828 stop:2103 length:276 start_codon:yes stop_codon:yes gene_type:complete
MSKTWRVTPDWGFVRVELLDEDSRVYSRDISLPSKNLDKDIIKTKGEIIKLVGLCKAHSCRMGAVFTKVDIQPTPGATAPKYPIDYMDDAI